MCRLYGFTPAIGMPDTTRRNIMWLAMMFGAAENNRDGWGVTDGQRLFKDAPSVAYDRRVPNAIERLSARGVHWLGHIRAASKDTAITHREAHPFLMRSADDSQAAFYGAHNGFFPQYFREVRKDAKGMFPRTDSWYAFRDIYYRAQDGAVPLQTAVMGFLEHVNRFSEYSLMFLDRARDELHVVRGNRPVAFAEFSTGERLYCTTATVLLNLQLFLRMSGAETQITDVVDLLPGTYIVHGLSNEPVITAFQVNEILEF